MSTLECSSAGNKNFSAFYAKVRHKDYEAKQSIEYLYQTAKIFMVNGQEVQYIDMRKCKGKKPIGFKIAGKKLNVDYGKLYYEYLWVRYFKENPDLIEVIKKYNKFTDKFETKNMVVRQAKTIKDIKELGVVEVAKRVKPLLEVIQRGK